MALPSPARPHLSTPGTYGKGRDSQPAPHQLDQHALLQRGGAAAQDRTAIPAQLQKFLLQLPLENGTQRLPIDDQPNIWRCSS